MMRKRLRPCRSIVAMIAIGAVIQMTAGDARAAIIRLKSKATVNSGVVVLADVADVFDRNLQTADALRNVTLQPTPAPGTETQIDFKMIRSRLQAHGFSLANLEFTGRSNVTVTGPRAQPAADRNSRRPTGPPATSWQVTRAKDILSKAILNYLRTARLGDVDMEVKLDTELVPLVISGQTSGYEIRGGRAPWDEWQTLTVRFIDRQDQLQSIQVEARVLFRPLVPTAQRAFPAGYVIRKQDLGLKRAPVASATYPTLDEIVGRETKRAIRQGQFIDVDDVRQVSLVRRGDIVSAVARIGGISVKQEKRARNDGALGEQVTLRTLDGGEQLEATVTGYHEAAVLGAGAILSERQEDRGVSFASYDEVAAPRESPVRLIGGQMDRRQPGSQTTTPQRTVPRMISPRTISPRTAATANTSTRLNVPPSVGAANQPTRLIRYSRLPNRSRQYR